MADHKEIMSDHAFSIFCEAFTKAMEAGKPNSLCYVAGYVALEKAGFDVQALEAHINSKDSFTLNVAITKADVEKRMAYGWASVISENGEPLVDREGDVIPEDELIKAAHEFMSTYRQSKDLHKDSQLDGVGCVGEVVESIVLTPDVQQALGIDLNKSGWFIGVKIHDDNVLAKVKSGEYAAFSIGGSGVRTPID